MNHHWGTWLSVLMLLDLILLTDPLSAQDAADVITQDPPSSNSSDVLRDYLAEEDSIFRWEKVREGKHDGVEYVELILRSQTWREIEWKHRLFVMKPQNLKSSKQAVLFIGGGRWKDEYEDPNYHKELSWATRRLIVLARQLQAPTAVLLQVPHQPMFDGMMEDEIISFTFERYLLTQDARWPLLLPMVKSAVRAMDAVQEFCQEQWSLPVESFTVVGASKRGWTTWLVGASDPRVSGIAPMVIDMLNMAPQMEHQVKTWGSFSEKLDDYTSRGIPRLMQTPAGKGLTAIVDPFAYRESLTLPKLIINGTNDRYWPLDALNLYWQDLAGPKYALYVPNQGHGIRDEARWMGAVAALHQQSSGGDKMPQPTWEFENDAEGLALSINTDKPASTCQVWLAESATRDFRDARWRSSEVRPQSDTYRYLLKPPKTGYAAVFGEMIYPGQPYPLHLSTNVRIVSAGEEQSK